VAAAQRGAGADPAGRLGGGRGRLLDDPEQVVDVGAEPLHDQRRPAAPGGPRRR
jgi:hypothetical protein